MLLSLAVPVALAGFLPVPAREQPVQAIVLATELQVRAAPRSDAVVAHGLPIGAEVLVVRIQQDWAQLDTGFWVKLPFIATLDDSMDASLREAHAAAKDPQEQAVWAERQVAWQVQRSLRQAQQSERERLRAIYRDPSEGTSHAPLILAPVQEAGSVVMALHPDAVVPAEVWVLPKRGVTRRGRVTGSELGALGCSDTPARLVQVEVDLGGEKAIAFSTDKRPPSSWDREAPAQEHSERASVELTDWWRQLAAGKELVVHTSAVGDYRWTRAFWTMRERDDLTDLDISDVFVSGGDKTVSPLQRLTVLAVSESSYAEHTPDWFRDLDGDGQLEVLFLDECATRATDLAGATLATSMTWCCGC